MSRPNDYVVIVRDQRFVLSQSQIEFDSPNYFTLCFLGDFAESKSREVTLSRDPHLFRIIVDYLSGYVVLPIRPDFLPPSMTPEVAQTNLRADATFYQLEGLLAMLDRPKTPPPIAMEEEPVRPPNMLLRDVRKENMFRVNLSVEGWAWDSKKHSSYEHSRVLPDPASFWVGVTPEEELDQFLEMWAETGEPNTYRESSVYNVLQRCVEVALRVQAPAIEDWEMMGWFDSGSDQHGRVKYNVYITGWSKKELTMRLS